jgi:hypothetical protein
MSGCQWSVSQKALAGEEPAQPEKLPGKKIERAEFDERPLADSSRYRVSDMCLCNHPGRKTEQQDFAPSPATGRPENRRCQGGEKNTERDNILSLMNMDLGDSKVCMRIILLKHRTSCVAMLRCRETYRLTEEQT